MDDFFPAFSFSRHEGTGLVLKSGLRNAENPILPLRNIATNDRFDDRPLLSIVLMEKATDFYGTFIPFPM